MTTTSASSPTSDGRAGKQSTRLDSDCDRSEQDGQAVGLGVVARSREAIAVDVDPRAGRVVAHGEKRDLALIERLRLSLAERAAQHDEAGMVLIVSDADEHLLANKP